GVGGCVLKGIQSFYAGSRACVRVGSEMSDSFEVNVGLRQGCVMSPWLFNVYMDGVVREVKMRTLGRGLELREQNGREWEVSQLLFADDTALVVSTEERLQRLGGNSVVLGRG
ncbi:MAG: reverse transcriptase domain-containing protein, partial [Pseudomonadota bacterium]